MSQTSQPKFETHVHVSDPEKNGILTFIKERFLTNPWAIIGFVLVFGVVICAICAPLIAPYNPNEVDLGSRLMKPVFLDSESQYFLGGDQLGRDLLSRILYGARISLMVGVYSVLIAMIIGVTLGLIAGYFGRWLEDLIMRLADIQLAFPFILIAIIIMSILGSGLWNIILVLGLTHWFAFARVVRGQVVALKNLEYIEAARVTGASNSKIIFKHILPNVSSSIIVLSTLYIAEFILLEAALTFLGLGIDPTIPSWGGMLAESRNYLDTAWWVATFPGLAIMLTVLGFNLLGDWLRDELDPNLKM